MKSKMGLLLPPLIEVLQQPLGKLFFSELDVLSVKNYWKFTIKVFALSRFRDMGPAS